MFPRVRPYARTVCPPSGAPAPSTQLFATQAYQRAVEFNTHYHPNSRNLSGTAGLHHTASYAHTLPPSVRDLAHTVDTVCPANQARASLMYQHWRWQRMHMRAGNATRGPLVPLVHNLLYQMCAEVSIMAATIQPSRKKPALVIP